MSDFQPGALELRHTLRPALPTRTPTLPERMVWARTPPTCVSSSVCFQVGALSVDLVAAVIVTSVYPPLPLRVRGLHR